MDYAFVDAMEFCQIQGGDGAWLSPHPVDSFGIHISFNGDPVYRANIYETYVPTLERVLEPFPIGHLRRVDGGGQNSFESASTLVGHATIPAARSGYYFEIARTGIEQHAPTPT
jgi:hypothetical protein